MILGFLMSKNTPFRLSVKERAKRRPQKSGISMLKFPSVFQGFQFSITDSGLRPLQKIPYQGQALKRPPPQAQKRLTAC